MARLPGVTDRVLLRGAAPAGPPAAAALPPWRPPRLYDTAWQQSPPAERRHPPTPSSRVWGRDWTYRSGITSSKTSLQHGPSSNVLLQAGRDRGGGKSSDREQFAAFTLPLSLATSPLLSHFPCSQRSHFPCP